MDDLSSRRNFTVLLTHVFQRRFQGLKALLSGSWQKDSRRSEDTLTREFLRMGIDGDLHWELKGRILIPRLLKMFLSPLTWRLEKIF